METITAKEIRKILRKQYPKLKHIWIFERELILLPGSQVDKILSGITAYKYPFKKKTFECEAFGIVAHAQIKIKIAELNLPYSWVFGHASVAYPRRGIHNQNIFITEDFKIKIFEPQTNIITNPNNETVFFVEM